MEILCERLKELRKERNLSIVELGNALGVDHSTVSRWENGVIVPSSEYLRMIAIYFQVSADYLLGLED